MTKIFEVIRKPLLTEKGQIMRESNVQVFEVAPWANKRSSCARSMSPTSSATRGGRPGTA